MRHHLLIAKPIMEPELYSAPLGLECLEVKPVVPASVLVDRAILVEVFWLSVEQVQLVETAPFLIHHLPSPTTQFLPLGGEG